MQKRFSDNSNCCGVSEKKQIIYVEKPWQSFTTTIHKIFETNSSFHGKQRTTGKVQFLFFSSFYAIIDKIFILGGKLGTRL